MVIGTDNSQLNSVTTLLGKSPGTDEFGFLDLQIFLYTSYSSRLGTFAILGLLRSALIFGGKFVTSKAAYSWLMTAK